MFLIGNLQQAGSNPLLTILLYSILAIVLLAIIFWLLNRPRREPDGKQREEKPVYKEKASPDDLTRIEGIGPKVAEVLNDTGIKTFEALAQANPAQVQETLNEAGLQMMKPEGWIEQAELAAKGDWDALERLQAELKGGRKK
ncbi:MAG TPA: DUF4332 domain-containing protein [Anaerolineales bacterium]|nr:DUF4332 domain-containing protein [Anaerolineales bacterium]